MSFVKNDVILNGLKMYIIIEQCKWGKVKMLKKKAKQSKQVKQWRLENWEIKQC